MPAGGTGYTELVARDVRERLGAYVQGLAALVPVVKLKVAWFDPVVHAEVDFASETGDGVVRRAASERLR